MDIESPETPVEEQAAGPVGTKGKTTGNFWINLLKSLSCWNWQYGWTNVLLGCIPRQNCLDLFYSILYFAKTRRVSRSQMRQTRLFNVEYWIYNEYKLLNQRGSKLNRNIA